MIKRLSCFLIALTLFSMPVAGALASPPAGASSSSRREPQLAAYAAVLLHQHTGQVLYAKNMEQRMYPASLTKLMTALLAVEYGRLNQIVTVGTEINLIARGSSTAGLQLGEKMLLRDLIYAMLLPSGNDAAYTVAVHIGRRHAGNKALSHTEAIGVFVSLMNERAEELGAKHTNFVNPHGFHDDNHYSTAYDLALIAQAAMAEPFLRDVVASPIRTAKLWSRGFSSRVWRNTNQLVIPGQPAYYRAATGLKTGTTPQAGFCLAASAGTGDTQLISIVLQSSEEGRWFDSRALLEYGLNNYSYHQLAKVGEALDRFPIKGAIGPWRQVAVTPAENFGLLISQAELNRLTLSIEWLVPHEKQSNGRVVLKPPLGRNNLVGRITYTLDGNDLATVDLLAKRSVSSGWLGRLGLALSRVSQRDNSFGPFCAIPKHMQL